MQDSAVRRSGRSLVASLPLAFASMTFREIGSRGVVLPLGLLLVGGRVSLVAFV